MTRKTREVPEEDEETEVPAVTGDASKGDEEEADVVEKDDVTGDASDVVAKDEEEAVVEDVSTDEAATIEDIPKKTKTVAVEEWSQLNSQPPLWTRYALIVLTWGGNCCSVQCFLGIPKT